MRNSLIYFQLSPIVHACLSPGDGQEWPKTHVCLTPKFLPEVMEICFGSGNIFKPLTAFITHSTLFWVGQGEAVRGNRREWRKWTEREREREAHSGDGKWQSNMIWFEDEWILSVHFRRRRKEAWREMDGGGGSGQGEKSSDVQFIEHWLHETVWCISDPHLSPILFLFHTLIPPPSCTF